MCHEPEFDHVLVKISLKRHQLRDLWHSLEKAVLYGKMIRNELDSSVAIIRNGIEELLLSSKDSEIHIELRRDQ